MNGFLIGVLDTFQADLQELLPHFIVFPDGDEPEDDVEDSPVLRFQLENVSPSRNAQGDLDAALTLVLIAPDTADDRTLLGWVGDLIGALEETTLGQPWTEARRSTDLFSGVFTNYEITLPITFNRGA